MSTKDSLKNIMKYLRPYRRMLSRCNQWAYSAMILVMENGTIIEKGTHKELLAAGGAYADLYNSQFA